MWAGLSECDLFYGECEWVWVSVTIFGLSVGECGHFWLGVGKCV